MKYIPQLDQTDCAAACLAMIASHYGKSLSIAQVRSEAGTDLVGTNLIGIVNAAEKYGLKATALKGSPEAFSEVLPTPFIVHIHIKQSDESWADHFVVVKKITKKYIEIWNPDPVKKKQRLSYEQFFEMWTNYAIFFESTVDFSKSEKNDNLLLKFIPVFLAQKKLLMYSFVSSIVLLLFGILISFYYKYIFDEIIYSKALFSLHTLSIGVFLIVFLKSIVNFIRSRLISHFSFKTDLQLNFSYLTHIFNLPLSFFETRKSGEILSRLSDLDKIKQTLFSIALTGFMDLIMLFVICPILFSIDVKLFLVSLFTVLVASVISVGFSKLYKKYYNKTMTQNADVQSFLYESINGAATVKALNAENIINTEYEKKKMTVTETSWKLNKFGNIQSLLTELINGLSSVLIYWVGSLFIIKGNISFGTLITFNSLLTYFSDPLFRLLNIQNNLQESLVAAKRVGEILELETETHRKSCYLKPKKFIGNIQFEKVLFGYGARKPIYKDLNLEIEGGSWTAFVGPTGSGKSTLIKLLLKFYEVQEGKIYIDGNDIRDIETKYLRSHIGYVPQDIFLFSGTVLENLRMHSPNSSFEEVIEVCKKVGANDFIQNLPKRYETILGEHGGGLSGGEKQKLALARALLGKPDILILDEATSSLDTISEKEIHSIIKNLKTENITVILISHRLSTVQGCDKIFVIKDGKICEQGTHYKLVNEKGLYWQLLKGQVV